MNKIQLVVLSVVAVAVATGSFITNNGAVGGRTSGNKRLASSPTCRESSIETTVNQADIIISGMVKRIETRSSTANASTVAAGRDRAYGAHVQINRVIKGHALLYDLLYSKHRKTGGKKNDESESMMASHPIIDENDDEEESSAGNETRWIKRGSKKFTILGTTVFIRNFGSASLCNSRVKIGYFRIFPLRVDFLSKKIYLNASLIQSYMASKINRSAKNLVFIQNGHEESPFKKCPDTASVSNVCQYGASCIMDIRTNLAHCECDISCDVYEPKPICGSDGVSYDSLCHLKLAKCLQQRTIKIVSHDTCEQLESSLCKNKVCGNYGTCKIDENGFYAKCVCPSECSLSEMVDNDLSKNVINIPPAISARMAKSDNKISSRSYDDQIVFGVGRKSIMTVQTSKQKRRNQNNQVYELFNQVVCGSNGIDYRNFCELKKHSCKQNKQVKIYYFGKCNPCDEIDCEYPRMCRLNENRQPICDCDLNCSNEHKPVCGSNGQTYLNECHMNLEACRSNTPITVFAPNDCSALKSNPCDDAECDQYSGSHCEIDLDGKAYCRCQENCEKTLNYVCGSDGVTYQNECELKKEACMSNQYIVVLHAGICGNMNPCIDHRCNFGGSCVLVDSVPVCKCMDCPEVYRPVCGSDKQTYLNICKLRRESCQRQTMIEVAYEGSCDKCKTMICPFYGTCVDNGGLDAKCVCQETCSDDIIIPICGDDGVTYNSLCHMQLSSCRSKKSIVVAYEGPCDPCKSMKCESQPTETVCGSDGKTYDNECYLNMTGCLARTRIRVVHKGPCSTFPSTQFRPQPVDNQPSNLYQQSCEDCKFNSDCQFFKETGTFQCLCSQFDCSEFEKSIICGSNKVIYKNKCELEKDQCVKQTEITELPLYECYNKQLPCFGLIPLVNPITNVDYQCRMNKECPSDSFCEKQHSKCCSRRDRFMLFSSLVCDQNSDCLILGDNMICSESKCVYSHSSCNCNPVGSYDKNCDQTSLACSCRPGYTGRSCDSCAPGYWSFKKSDHDFECIPCSCNKFGSVSENCSQSNGKCTCKPNVLGVKCSECTPGRELTQDGCISVVEEQKEVENLCSSISCNYPGSYCSIEDGMAKCVCDSIECTSDNEKVCGEDGQTYASRCDLMRLSCLKQTTIEIAHLGQCSQERLEEISFDVAKSSHLVPYGTKKCVKDYQCGRNMECLENICYCKHGFYPIDDHCASIEDVIRSNPKPSNGNNQKRYTLNSCRGRPCAPGGYCESLLNGRFFCHCSLFKTGRLCEKTYHSFMFPSFSAYSFLEMYPVEASLSEFSIQIEFKLIKTSGNLFCAIEEESNQLSEPAFLCLSLHDCFIELRLHENSVYHKPMRLGYSLKVGAIHQVQIRRALKSITIQLDENPRLEVNVASELSYSYSLITVIFGNSIASTGLSNKSIGYLANNESFQGCLQYFKLNGILLNTSFPSEQIKNGLNIEECPGNECRKTKCLNKARCRMKHWSHNNSDESECVCTSEFTGRFCELRKNSSCASSPCLNNGVCVPSGQLYQCICANNYDGQNCQTKVEVKSSFIASFNGSSFIKKPSLNDIINTIDIIFLPFESDGVLLYMGNRADRKQILGLKLHNGYAKFIISVNGNREELISRNPISLERWHQVRIRRQNNRFDFFVDTDLVITSSEIQLSRLELDEYIYIGGIEESVYVPRGFRMRKGLRGAIQKAFINVNYEPDIRMHAVELNQVTSFTGFPCDHNRCGDNGVCLSHMNHFKCKCLNNFSGKFCQYSRKKKSNNRIKRGLDYSQFSNKSLYFDGHTELLYKNRLTETITLQASNRFHVAFRTSQSNGLLIYTGSEESKSFLVLSVRQGRLHYAFRLSKHKRTFSLTSPFKIDDNKWHSVTIERSKKSATLLVDQEYRVNATFDEINYVGYGYLTTDGYVRLGGYRKIPIGKKSSLSQGFRGCVARFEIEDRPVDIVQSNLNSNYHLNVCKPD